MPNHTLDVPVLIPDAKDCTACAERLRNQLGSRERHRCGWNWIRPGADSR